MGKKRLRIGHGLKYERKANGTNRHGGLSLTTVVMDEERKVLARCDGLQNLSLSLSLYTVEL
jgi:hypothetical protein